MKAKTVGKIIAWEEENNEHYPIFSFTTKEYAEIKGRCIAVSDKEITEPSLESEYPEASVKDILASPLPHDDIYISYDTTNPTKFYAFWIMEPEWFLLPKEEKHEKLETTYQFVKYYLIYALFGFTIPVFGLILIKWNMSSYSEKYNHENDEVAHKRANLYKILFFSSIIFWIIIAYLYVVKVVL